MQEIPLAVALGGIASIPHFFVWRLTWSEEDRKYLKQPIANFGEPWPMDAADPANWLTYEEAAGRVAVWNGSLFPQEPGRTYSLGWYMTPGCGYWFLDFDHCVVDGQYQGAINEWSPMLPGCFFESSSSGDGAHIIGRGELPPHGKKNRATGTELYTEKRGICFSLSGKAWGSADVAAGAIVSIANEYFPPRPEGEDGEFLKPRADWVGPTDDADLIRRATSSMSLAAKAGNRATFHDLWTGNVERLSHFFDKVPGNSCDMALATHLAFWTGCDGPRIERLMRQSALVRPKWDEHRTYLRELTINGACAAQKDVCKDAPRVNVAAEMYGLPPLPALPPLPGALPPAPGLPTSLVPTVLMVSDEAKVLIDSLLDIITSSPDWAHVHNVVIPAVRDAHVAPALMPRLENAINKRLELWDAKLPIAKLRALLNPPKATGVANEDGVIRPDWVSRYVYLRQGDSFFDMSKGDTLSITSFKATHDRDMPIKGDGPAREDSAMWALQQWGVPVVHDTMYYPGQPAIIEHDGRQWANLYNESTFPAPAEYTAEGVAAIERFQRHMWVMCSQRERVYLNLIAFLAHNVQFPGKKIRWVPIIKGVEGDGKTIVSRVMQAAMGWRNVQSIGPLIVANSGGFTDWAHGHAFTMLEEMHMTGSDRYRMANAMKEFISNDVVTINPKGGKPKKVMNTNNSMAGTNHNDGVPLDNEKDRRWFVIFTPFDSREALHAALGLESATAHKHFDAMFDSLKREPGQWRKWLLEFPIPEWFQPDAAAMATDEKQVMAASGVDDLESIARAILEDGTLGVTNMALSSACLTSAMKHHSFREGIEIPKGHTLHHLLNRIGFMKVPKMVKWDGAAHRVWVRPGISHDPAVIRVILDGSKKVAGVPSIGNGQMGVQPTP